MSTPAVPEVGPAPLRSHHDPEPRAIIPAPVVVALALVYVIWSSTYLAIRVLVHEVPPFGSGGLRYLLAGVILLAVQRARGEKLPAWRQWAAALPTGALLFAVGNGLVASAERTIASGVAAVVCGTMPLWAGVMGPAIGERATRREWLGMGVGFAGVVVLSMGGDLRADPWAALLLVLAPIGWAAGSLASRRLPIAKGASGAATHMITGGIVMLVIATLTGEQAPSAISSTALLSFAYLTVFGSVIAFSAYSYLLQHARPALAMSYAYVNPALAVVLGAVMGAEHVGGVVVVATAMIVAAVFLLVRGRAPGK
ncbi:MAG: drug/metabolite exporter YedA [Myxococcota bacterium]|nr:drug/metabolite exporter YedA [Myxococcota bacterium]